MPKESIITVFRSTSTDTPTGLTFGELAYSDLNGKLFIGKNDGTSLWVGAGVTAGAVGTNSEYLVPTQSAVKSYVDGVIGGGSVVNTVNATGGAVTITGDGGAITNVQSGKANTITARLASTSATGAASFSSANFDVSAAGAVTIKVGGVTNGTLANSSVTVSAGTGLGGGGSVALGSSVTLTNTGVLSLNSLTGARTLTGDGGAIIGANNDTIRARLATTGATGVASFSSGNFDVSAAGAVSVKTGGISNTNLANSTISGVSLGQTLNALTIGTGLGGAASYNGSAAVTISNTGVLSLNGLTGARTLTGDGGAIIGVGNTAITTRLATTGATGVASFSSDNFSVAANGAVTIKDGGITNAELAASFVTLKSSSGDGGQAINLGTDFIVQGTSNQITTSRSGNTVTVGLPNDVTIAGNLTVNGTVVTTNVENFVVEDPLLMLGTGNAADSADLGFYARYDASAKYTGLFRDASDVGKYKFFTGLTAEPTTTVNTNLGSYTMATLVARIDGGTF
jgi:hypothetical protein